MAFQKGRPFITRNEDNIKIKPDKHPELPATSRKATPKQKYLGGAAIGLLIIAVLIIIPRLNHRSASTPANLAPMEAAPALGPKNAPITIIEYADFGCPSCWAWHKQGTLKQLQLKYGEKIRFIWRDYPVITLLSPKAAEAGQCANEQGRFWEFHDAVYEHDGAIEASNLRAYAATIGLKMSQFDDCVRTRRFKERVIAEEAEAFNHGYNGAPFFMINDKVLIGPQNLAVFSGLIDPLLASGK
jgi:protein-disulfide isomerase